MPRTQKILLLDDDEQMLDLYQELLKQLPGAPEVHVSNSGARAIALLESEPFDVLITDLRMPKMDGLQVLAIVRRKFPDVRMVVLTSVPDEEYRSRAYAQGVELFWQKPTNGEEVRLFQDCIESLLDRKSREAAGFRGVQNKSLVDLVQLECLSQSSSVLRITQGPFTGKIWVQNGDVTDAVTGELTGEAAFREILSWKSGNFDILAAEPDHPRAITASYQGLLLDSAQAMDESKGQTANGTDAAGKSSVLSPLARVDGVEFLLTAPLHQKGVTATWAVENATEVADWARDAHNGLRAIGEKLGAGDLGLVLGFGLQRHWGVAADNQKGLLCAGFRRAVDRDRVENSMKQLIAKWVS